MREITVDEFHEAPMPPHARRRLRAVFRYLIAHWPPPRPVRLRIRKIRDEDDAVAYTEPVEGSGGKLEIVLDARMSYGHAYYVLLHEHAHAVTWGVREAHHGPAWAGTFAAIVTAFDDDGAHADTLDW